MDAMARLLVLVEAAFVVTTLISVALPILFLGFLWDVVAALAADWKQAV